jgi:type I restriction enzyme M protein
VILVLNRKKRHAGEILLINASRLFSKGRPKNYLEEDHVRRITELHKAWEAAEGLSAVITRDEAMQSDFDLSPSRYVLVDSEQEVLPPEEAVVLLREAEEERAGRSEAERGAGRAWTRHDRRGRRWSCMNTCVNRGELC